MSEKIKILYRDDMLAVAVKPCGVLSQKDRTGEPSMTELLSEQLEREVFPVHRLDRAVGGVMIFALNRSAAGKLSMALGTEGFKKEYLAVIHGVPEEKKAMLSDYLAHDARRNMTSVVSAQDKEAKEAHLTYEVLATNGEGEETFSLVRVHLHTGRTHQIRVQFASRGLPLAGDGKYGSRDRHALALWSNRLAFRHPMKKKHLAFIANPDITRTPWDLFSKDAYHKNGEGIKN